ncbi:MAG: ADOP family duplicated permease [Terriglobales bacterium]
MNGRALLSRMRALVMRQRLERDLDAELEFHRTMAAATGNQRRFGNEVRVREQAREAWMFPWLESWLQDVRIAARGLRRAPGFTLAVVGALALGIGANAAMFSLAWAVLWQPLPYPEANRIVEVRQARGAQPAMMASSFDIASARRGATGLLDWSRYRGDGATLTGAGDPAVLRGAEIEAHALSTLGARPLLGRLLLPGDDHPGAAPAVLIRARLWRRRWQANPALVGHMIELDGKPYTVVGILPDSFEFPDPLTLYWLAWQEKPEAPGARDVGAIARLAPGVSLAQASARVNQQMRRLAGEHAADKNWRFVLTPLRKFRVGGHATEVRLLMGVAGLLLLIAAANVACLLAARGQARRQELATRAALGAGRARILRQLWTEAAILIGAGAAASLALAAGGITWLRAAAPADTPRLDHVILGWPVLAFTAALAALLLAVGLAPAWTTSGHNLDPHLRRSHPPGAGLRGRRAWVVAQVALSLPLLAGAGLLLAALVRMSAVPLGFQPHRVLSFDLWLPAARYPTAADRWRLLQSAQRRFAALPGVESAAFSSFLPFNGNASSVYSLPGKLANPNDFSQMIGYNAISPGYLATMRIRSLAGRGFTAADAARDAPVTLINQAAAAQLFPDRNPIGQSIQYAWGHQPWRTVVGVVANVQQYLPDAPGPPDTVAYVPLADTKLLPADVMFVLRSTVPPLTLLPSVRRALRGLDPAMPVALPESLDQLYADALSRPRFLGGLVGGFAALALLLSALGIFGVLAYSVGERRQELALRSALGAPPRQLLELVIRQTLTLLGFGLAAGLALSLLLTRYLHALLFGLSPTDPRILAAAALLVLATGLAAAVTPARRALRADPARVLRCE